MRGCWAFAFVSLHSSTCFAQSSFAKRSSEIVINRADITESSVVVPPGTLLLKPSKCRADSQPSLGLPSGSHPTLKPAGVAVIPDHCECI
jgi:hypothetical protein